MTAHGANRVRYQRNVLTARTAIQPRGPIGTGEFVVFDIRSPFQRDPEPLSQGQFFVFQIAAHIRMEEMVMRDFILGDLAVDLIQHRLVCGFRERDIE